MKRIRLRICTPIADFTTVPREFRPAAIGGTGNGSPNTVRIFRRTPGARTGNIRLVQRPNEGSFSRWQY